MSKLAKFYIAQTGRPFKERYKKHFSRIKTKARIHLNIMETDPMYGTVEKKGHNNKGRELNVLEEFQMYKQF